MIVMAAAMHSTQSIRINRDIYEDVKPYNGNVAVTFDNGWSKPSVPKEDGYRYWDKGKHYEDCWEEKKIQPEEEHGVNSNSTQYVHDTPKGYTKSVLPFKEEE